MPAANINTRRVILGGLVAGLVANAFDFVITTYLMAAEFSSMLARLNVDAAATRAWIGVFAAADLVWGFLLVFTYAAIRPRFGPGPRTAVLAGVLPWCSLVIFGVLLMAMGLRTFGSYAKSSALYLVSAIASSLAGAALYRE